MVTMFLVKTALFIQGKWPQRAESCKCPAMTGTLTAGPVRAARVCSARRVLLVGTRPRTPGQRPCPKDTLHQAGGSCLRLILVQGLRPTDAEPEQDRKGDGPVGEAASTRGTPFTEGEESAGTMWVGGKEHVPSSQAFQEFQLMEIHLVKPLGVRCRRAKRSCWGGRD